MRDLLEPELGATVQTQLAACGGAAIVDDDDDEIGAPGACTISVLDLVCVPAPLVGSGGDDELLLASGCSGGGGRGEIPSSPRAHILLAAAPGAARARPVR